MSESLPSALRASVEENDRLAEQLAEQYRADHGLVDEAPPTPEDFAPETTVEELKNSPKTVEPQVSVNDVLLHTPPVAEEKANDPSYWARRFDTLIGKYNAEVPALHSKVKQLERELTEAKAAARPALPAEDIHALERQATDALLEGDVEKASELRAKIYGEVAERARADVGKEVASLRKETAEQRFWTDLNKVRPDWEEVNSDPAFLQWLGETDPLTGKQRQSFLDAAQSQLDAVGTARVFNLWLQGRQQTEEPAARPSAPSLENQVVPSRSAGKTPAQGKRIYTGADIDRIYTAIRKREVDEATAERLQADIELAVAEGRYRP